MKSARMQKKAGNNVMGMIRAAGLGYEYLRYDYQWALGTNGLPVLQKKQ